MLKNEKGAVPIIEATFIFPIVFFVLFFLLYMGMYILQSILIYTQAQKIATVVSKSLAVTGYEKVGKYSAEKVSVDFKDDSYFTSDSVNTIYNTKAKLYRYFDFNPISGNSDIEDIKSSLSDLIENINIINAGDVSCDIDAKNYFINQKVIVTITREGTIPQIFSYIGMAGVENDMVVTAVATSSDGAEFVRNTDLVYDFVTFLSDRLHISDSISAFKEKIQHTVDNENQDTQNVQNNT